MKAWQEQERSGLSLQNFFLEIPIQDSEESHIASVSDCLDPGDIIQSPHLACLHTILSYLVPHINSINSPAKALQPTSHLWSPILSSSANSSYRDSGRSLEVLCLSPSIKLLTGRIPSIQQRSRLGTAALTTTIEIRRRLVCQILGTLRMLNGREEVPSILFRPLISGDYCQGSCQEIPRNLEKGTLDSFLRFRSPNFGIKCAIRT